MDLDLIFKHAQVLKLLISYTLNEGDFSNLTDRKIIQSLVYLDVAIDDCLEELESLDET